MVLAGIPALFALSLNASLLNADLYKNAIASQAIYDKLPVWIADLLELQPGTDTVTDVASSALAYMTGADYKALFQILIPEESFYRLTDNLVDQYWAYLQGESSRLVLYVDLSTIKSRINKASEEIARLVVSTWPPCQSQDVPKPAPGQTSSAMQICQPAGAWLDITIGLAATAIRGNALYVPEQLNIASSIDSPDDANNGFVEVSKVIGTIKRWIYLPLAFFFFSTALMLLLVVTQGEINWKWAGWPLLIVSTLSAGIILLLAWLNSSAVTKLQQGGSETTSMITAEVGSLIGILTGKFILYAAIAAGLLFVVGIVLVLLKNSPRAPVYTFYDEPTFPQA
jgi:hypothetical protein